MTSSNLPTVVITGGTGGIGLKSTIGIAKRRLERVSSLQLVVGDISSYSGVDELTKKLLEKSNNKIDLLINNAGYLGDDFKKSNEGLEMHFAVNVAAPWRLTLALLPALKKAEAKARVINVTGGEEAPGAIDVDNMQAEKGFKGLMTYGHSKSVAEAMTMALAKKLEAEGVYVNVVFPGRASTAMTGQLSFSHLPGIMKLFYSIFWLMFRYDGGKSAEKAAVSSIWAATTTDLEGVHGKYFDSTTKERKLDPTAYQEDIHNKIVQVIEEAG